MICFGCNQEKKLIRTHIIPESFFRKIKTDSSMLRMYTNVDGGRTKKTPSGVYDTETLCAECEDRFQMCDNYGFDLLINKADTAEAKYKNEKIIGYQIENIDYGLLKLFFMSILWRASISKQNFYAKVSLGKLESKLKYFIWNGCTGGKHDFSFVLAKFNELGQIKTMFDPHPEKWNGIKYYRLYLSNYILYIKADSRKTHPDWEKFIPTNNTLLIVDRGLIENSNEYGIIEKVLNLKDRH